MANERWWRKRVLGIYQPDLCPGDLATLDVARLMADATAAHAEALALAVAGPLALYPTSVPYLAPHPALGGRDMLGEVMAAAARAGLRVLACLDLSHASEAAARDHPEWLHRAPDSPAPMGAPYRTCPQSGYQNEAVAWPLLQELLGRYAPHGIWLDGLGFYGDCACPACAQQFGADPSAGRRRSVVRAQVARVRDVVRSLRSGVLLAATADAPATPMVARRLGADVGTLAPACDRVVVAAGGGEDDAAFRWWPSLAAQGARASRRMRSPMIEAPAYRASSGQPAMPISSVALEGACYQAMAQGAGLVVRTAGPPNTQGDPRTIETISHILGFLRRQQSVLDGALPFQPVALVWPDEALRRLEALGPHVRPELESEVRGLFDGLVRRGVLFGLLSDADLDRPGLARHAAVVLPTAVALDSAQLAALIEWVRAGGRLIVCDSLAARRLDGRPLPMTPALAAAIGGVWSEHAGLVPFGLPAAPDSAALEPLAPRGPVPLEAPYRRWQPDGGQLVWLWAASPPGPNATGPLMASPDALVATQIAGTGEIVYIALGLGRAIAGLGHSDAMDLLRRKLYPPTEGQPRLTTDAPSGVLATLALWHEGVVIHLVNAAGAARSDGVVPLGPITLDLAWDGPARAELCAPGQPAQPLACEELWNRVRMVVPRLEVYAQVVVRTG